MPLTVTVNCTQVNSPKQKAALARGFDSGYDITVSDNGFGIAEQYWEQIFEIFLRLHNRQSYDGSGIGLAMCRKIARNHDGEIFVRSVQDAGSAFHVILPGVTN